MMNKISFQNNSFKIIAWSFVFLILFLIVHSILISVVTFFHFQLDHQFYVIEDYIFRNSWELIVASKFISLYFLLKFLLIQEVSQTPIRDIIYNNSGLPSRKIYVAASFLIIFTLFLLKPVDKIDRWFSSTYYIVGYLGNVGVYVLDSFLIIVFQKLFPIKNSKQYWFTYIPVLILNFILFLLVTNENISTPIFPLHLLTCLFLLNEIEGKFTNILAYLTLVAGPLAVLIGLDPIWETRYSLMYNTEELKFLYLVPIWMLALIFYKTEFAPSAKHLNQSP